MTVHQVTKHVFISWTGGGARWTALWVGKNRQTIANGFAPQNLRLDRPCGHKVNMPETRFIRDSATKYNGIGGDDVKFETCLDVQMRRLWSTQAATPERRASQRLSGLPRPRGSL